MGSEKLQAYEDPAGMVSSPSGIIGSPDGDLWFTNIGNGRVGRIRPEDGRIETYADPAGNVELPANIFPGADGRIWFTCLGSNRLGAIDPSAPDPGETITTYRHPGLDKPVGLKATPDGRLWFSQRGTDAIGCVDPRAEDPTSSIQLFRHDRMSAPAALIASPNGRLWWVNSGNDTIGRLDVTSSSPVGTVTTFAAPSGIHRLRAWAVDADQRHLWLTTQRPPSLLRIDTGAADPTASLRPVSHERLRAPDGIWLGPDGALWLTDTDADLIVRFEPRAEAGDADDFDFFGGPPHVDGPFDIKASGDPGDRLMWFTNKRGNTIGSIHV